MIGNRIIDVIGQFGKVCPSWSQCLGFTNEQRLEIVVSSLECERRRSEINHWAYDYNRHQALIELRDAIEDELKKEKPMSLAEILLDLYNIRYCYFNGIINYQQFQDLTAKAESRFENGK